ncbi:MAG: hypothetical protein NTX79_01750 [Candidatus Micrarchaeota archaeon]|nr:hypothetical protein [Candidatus Micrarchaeota archaeon]
MEKTEGKSVYEKLMMGSFDKVEVDPNTGIVSVKKRDMITESNAEVAKSGEIISAKTTLTWVYWILILLTLGFALIALEIYRFAVIGFGNNYKRNEKFITSIKRCLLSS